MTQKKEITSWKWRIINKCLVKEMRKKETREKKLKNRFVNEKTQIALELFSWKNSGSTKENTIKEMKVDPQIFENKFRNENTGSWG